MLFNRTPNEKELKAIAQRCDSKQLLKDVSFACRIRIIDRRARVEFLYSDAGLLVGYYTKDGRARVLGIGTTTEYRGKGYAKLMLEWFIKNAPKDTRLIETRTTDGLGFYLHQGFEVVATRGGDFILQKRLTDE